MPTRDVSSVSESIDASGPRPFWIPMLLVAGFVAAALSITILSYQSLPGRSPEEVDYHLKAAAATIKLRLDAHRDYLQLIAEQRALGAFDDKAFQERVSRYVRDNPGLINVTWADSHFVIRATAPLEANRQVLGLTLSLPEPKRASHLARDTRQPAYTRPFVVIQGKPALEVYVPVYRGDTFLGTFGAVYSVQDLLAATLPPSLRALYAVSVMDEHDGVVAQLFDLSRQPDTRLAAMVALEPVGQGTSIKLIPYRESPWPVGLLALLTLALGAAISYGIWVQHREIRTRRRQALALERSQADFAEAQRIAHVGSWEWDVATGFTHWSEESFLIYGVDARTETPGYPLFFRCVHPDDRAAVRLKLEQALRGETRYEIEHRIVRPDGRIRYIETRGEIQFDAERRPLRIIGTAHDVTEWREAQQALSESEQRFRAIFEQAAMGIAVVGPDGRFLRANQKYCDIVGRPENELRTLSFQDITHPDDLQRDLGLVRRLVAAEIDTFSMEKRYLRPDGTPVWVTLIDSLVRNADGSAKYFVAVVEDITARRQSEAERRAIQQQLQDILDYSATVVYVKDLEGRYLLVNRRHAELMGLAREQIIGKTDYDLFPPQLADRFQRNDREVIESQGAAEFEEEVALPDGLHTAISIKFPLWDSTGRLYAIGGISTDVTERKRAEEALKAAHDAALEASRLKTRFLANMSHEIRTPMNGVLGMARLLAKTTLNERQRELLRDLTESGESLLALINDLLDISRIEVGRIALSDQEFEVRTLFEDALELFAELAGQKGLELNCLIDEEVPARLRGDPMRLRQILINLIGNAVKFTDRGEILLTLKIIERSPEAVRLRCDVRDTGIGIEASMLQRVFEPFTQADGSAARRHEGTGLGLTICRQLVEMMGGTIGVESRPGEGSCFSFEARFHTAAPSEQTRRALTGLRLLVATANPATCKVIMAHLAAFGVNADSAASGTEWLERLRHCAENSTGYDMAVIDTELLDRDHLDIARDVRADYRLAHTQFIVLSRLEHLICSEDSPPPPRVCCLKKPVRREPLYACLLRLAHESGDSRTVQEAGHERSAEDRPIKARARVLVVDDNEINLRLALYLLQELQVTAEAARSGDEALQRLQQRSYDLIFMDCHMPGIDGYEVTQRLRGAQSNQRPAVVAMTADVMEENYRRCRAAGMDDLLPKPLTEEGLRRVLGQWLPAKAE